MNEEQKAREKLKQIGNAIGGLLPEGYGFVLMVFETNTSEGRLDYISDCQREDVIKAMKEFIAKTEREWGMHQYEGQFGMGGKPL